MKDLRKFLMKIIVVWCVFTLIMSGVIHRNRYLENKEIANRWYSKYSIIAHALGDIDDYKYTNSLEAFNKHYAAGTRVFEMDFSLTSDNKIVCTHGWYDHKLNRLGMENADDEPMSYAEFMSSPIYGKYTPMDLDGAVKLLTDHEDVYLVLDFGADLDWDYETNTDQIFDLDALMLRNRMVVDAFVKAGVDDRVIPQIYYEEHFRALDAYHHFDNYIYTLYKNFENTTPKEIMDFTYNNGIYVITSNLIGDQEITTKEVLRQIKLDRTLTKHMALFLHTYNDQGEVDTLIENGYSGFYTDILDETYYKQTEE